MVSRTDSSAAVRLAGKTSEGAKPRAGAVPLCLAAATLLLLSLPGHRLDLFLLDQVSIMNDSSGPSSRVTLILAEGLTSADHHELARLGARSVVPGRVSPPSPGWFEGGLYRQIPPEVLERPDLPGGPVRVSWRGRIDSGAFLTYDLAELRGRRIPPEAIWERRILFGSRTTGGSALIPTPAGTLTELEYLANILDSEERGASFSSLPRLLQMLLLLLPLVSGYFLPSARLHLIIASGLGVTSLALLVTENFLVGTFALVGGWCACAMLKAVDPALRLERLLAEGRFREVAELHSTDEAPAAAQALADLGRVEDVLALIGQADLRRFPSETAIGLASVLEERGHDEEALRLLEWAVVASSSGSSTASERAADLRKKREGMRGLLGLEGIRRLISQRYKDLEFLGQGGMGILLRGRDTFVDRPVAIKVLSPGLLGDPGARGRFRREVETLMSLNDSGVVQIFSVHHEDLLYFSMELLPGRTVHEAVRQSPGEVDLKRVLRSVAEIMAHCHDRGVLHRDLKSDNVFLLDDGSVKLIDFGIARVTGASELTADGELIGTLGYLAPELFQGGKTNRRTDVFAFGVMAFELHALELPFAHPLSSVIPDLPEGTGEDLGRVILRCLSRDPMERYGDFHELLSDLNRSDLEEFF